MVVRNIRPKRRLNRLTSFLGIVCMYRIVPVVGVLYSMIVLVVMEDFIHSFIHGSSVSVGYHIECGGNKKFKKGAHILKI